MEVVKTSDFDSSFEQLPIDIKRLYVIQEKRFIENRHDPRLHIKKVLDLASALSFRITRRYRVFFYFQNPEKAIFFAIDHRKDIYR